MGPHQGGPTHKKTPRPMTFRAPNQNAGRARLHRDDVQNVLAHGTDVACCGCRFVRDETRRRTTRGALDVTGRAAVRSGHTCSLTNLAGLTCPTLDTIDRSSCDVDALLNAPVSKRL